MGKGRKRRSGKRERSGRLQRFGRRDHGTPETQSLREWWAGKGDPVLTSYPLGVLLTNSVINEAEHGAGCRYAWLYWAVFGRRSIGAVGYELRSRGIDDAPDRAEEGQALTLVETALDNEIRGGAVRRVDLMELDRLVLFEETPRWMRPGIRTPAEAEEQRLVLSALRSLVRALA